MRIKHYTLIVAFLAISMGIPLVQGCSDPFDEYGNGGTEMPVRDGWTSVSMSVEGLGLRNPLTRSLTPEGENSTAAERIRVLVFDKDNKFSYEAKVTSYIPSSDPADKKGKGTMTLLAKNTPSGDTSTFVMLANVTRFANTDADGLAGKTREEVSEDKLEVTGKVPAQGVFVDGLGVGDVGNIVLRDRQLLSQNGLLIIVVTLDKYSNNLIAGPDIVSRGFVYVRESETLMEDCRAVVEEALEKCLRKNITDWGKIKTTIKDSLSEFLWKRTKRSPMILPIITEV